MAFEEDDLNPKQRLFATEYIVDLNATKAAKRAGYSEDSAGQIGHELLKKHEVQKLIQEAMAERSKRTEITADMVLAELGRVAFSNMAHYARWNSHMVDLVDSEELSEDATRCVSEITQTVTAEGGTVKFKLHDKVGALEKIARHLGMFNDKLRLQGDDANPLHVGGKIEIELVRPKDSND